MTGVRKLKTNWEFRRVYKQGKAIVCKSFVMYLFKTRGAGVRFGITAGKKIGCAVKRNRAKRVLFAAFSQCLPHITGNYNVVLVARHKILSQKSTQVFEMMREKLTENGIYE